MTDEDYLEEWYEAAQQAKAWAKDALRHESGLTDEMAQTVVDKANDLSLEDLLALVDDFREVAEREERRGRIVQCIRQLVSPRQETAPLCAELGERPDKERIISILSENFSRWECFSFPHQCPLEAANALWDVLYRDLPLDAFSDKIREITALPARTEGFGLGFATSSTPAL